MAPFPELQLPENSKGLKIPSFQDNLNPVGFNDSGNDPLMLDPENAFADLPDTGFGLRHRSMTFHYPAKSMQLDHLTNSFAEPKHDPVNQNTIGRLSFDFND